MSQLQPKNVKIFAFLFNCLIFLIHLRIRLLVVQIRHFQLLNFKILQNNQSAGEITLINQLNGEGHNICSPVLKSLE